MDMPKWISELVEQGGSVNDCIALWKEMQVTEREERAASRDMKRAEMATEIRMRELEIKEKEIVAQQALGMAPSAKGDQKCSKLPKFIEGQDPDVFLKSFEKLAALHKWAKTEWPVRIVPLLSGKALEAYSRLSDTDSADYDKIKDAILKRYELTAEAYREKFRSTTQDKDESFREFRVKLERYLAHWCEREKIGNSFDKLLDLMLREQLLQTCSKDLRLWVNEHKPESAQEVVELAESYQVAHKIENLVLDGSVKKQQAGNFSSHNRGSHVLQREQVRGKDFKKSFTPQAGSKQKTCFICHKQGHMSYDCTERKGEGKGKKGNFGLCVEAERVKKIVNRDDCEQGNIVKLSGVAVDADVDERKGSGLEIVKGTVEGKPVSVLRDTGSSTVFVHSSIVNGMERTGRMKDIWLADGSVRHCEEVWIDVSTPYISGVVLALVLNIPFADLVIGNYINTSIPKDVCTEKIEKEGKNLVTDACQAVQTRAQKKEDDKKEEKIQASIEKLDKLQTDGMVQQVSKLYSRDQLRIAQSEDTSLDKVRSLVQDYPGKQSSYFILKSGILYRIYVTPSEEEIHQIVLPQKYRSMVLELAHDIPLSGHLGIKKTRDRILQHYFWPGMFEDVALYCKSCQICQLSSSKGKSAKVPLVSIPPMDVPFRRIAIDFVGPLPLTERKNRYILVIVDCATRYPEAVALRSQDAETVVESLMEIFSRVGFPEELLSDQGSNFKSSLMVEVCRLLKVEKMVSSVYHPQTNGMCEKFNGVLKRMLKAYASLEPKTWDKYLVYVLFAYREVPNDTTGFSPFELLYGRNIRGPLSVLKEQWEEPEDCQSSVLSYLIETRERLKTLSELAHENEIKAKHIQKRYYDKKARVRDIEVGSKVLVLLPTSENKLLAQWKGPYVVTDKVGSVDYKVKVRGREKVYHVNMLKTWYERPDEMKNEVEYLACLDVVEDKVEDEYLDIDFKATPQLVGKETVKDVKISDELTNKQHDQVSSLIREFSDIFTDVPKRTDLVQHKVKLTTDKPIYRKPYPIPFALREKVQQEIDDMLKLGIIEPSDSPYAAPVVLVKKKDSTIRFCCDYREINKFTEFDPSPMPQIDSVLHKIGKAKFVSKIDLTKGYWQLSLDDDAKRKSAFVTPMGQYQFTVMPFGMVNSSASFVRLMKKVLKDCDGFADSFIDDIGIYSDTFKDHLKHIRYVLQALRKANIAARPTKCCFGFSKLEFLGHIVGGGKIMPTQDKIKAILSFKPPTTKKQVRSFIGLIGFYRKFIPNFSRYSAPITDLTKKGLPTKVKWTSEHQECFDRLKSMIASEPVLRAPDFSLTFILCTDACKTGVGCVLEQEFKDGRHPILYMSKKFSETECRYSVIEKECYAIVWAVKSLWIYLEGKEFVIETDHAPLQWLQRMKMSNQRLLRWSLTLQELKFKISYVPGKLNIVADALSRLEE